MTTTENATPSAPGPAYLCGNPECKAPVVLVDYRRRVYQYTCESCGHTGVVTHQAYRLWTKKTERKSDQVSPGVGIEGIAGALAGPWQNRTE